ncbi:MAG: PA2778 family cysteine peptidase [Pseudomonadota bacterium]
MKRWLVWLACLSLLAGCTSSLQYHSLVQQTPARFSEPGRVAGVPFFPQDEYQCGPAALATVLGASQLEVTPETLVPLVYVPERQGSFQVEMVATARSFGRLAYQIPPTLEALFAEINSGHPVLVLQNLGLDRFPQWHFSVAKGFDIERRKMVLNSGRIENYEVSLAVFERTWARSEYWAIVVLEPGQVPVSADPVRYFNAVVALEQTNAPEQVIPAYLGGLQRWPGQRQLLMGYGNLLYSSGALEEAKKHFQNLLEQHPDYAPAHNNLAQIHLEQGRLAAAAEHAERAIALGGPYVEEFRRTLAEIRSGR